jgi:hypothetical protein
MRATLDKGQDALAQLVVAWLIREAGWGPEEGFGAFGGAVQWYLHQVAADERLAKKQQNDER